VLEHVERGHDVLHGTQPVEVARHLVDGESRVAPRRRGQRGAEVRAGDVAVGGQVREVEAGPATIVEKSRPPAGRRLADRSRDLPEAELAPRLEPPVRGLVRRRDRVAVGEHGLTRR
jgi:hypothetical protein